MLEASGTIECKNRGFLLVKTEETVSSNIMLVYFEIKKQNRIVFRAVFPIVIMHSLNYKPFWVCWVVLFTQNCLQFSF